MVSGKVISTSNEIMDFATVQVKGTSIGTRPDEKGIYHLKVDAGKHTLVFKAMGYATVERTVTLQAGERQKLNVKMHQKVTMFAKANTLRQVGFRSSEASRLRPHGKPPRCFS